ncbi:MAG TPA: hypothetical protein VFY66_19820 [Anaerolineales bacterium]|nr:hypothetical protein [Anaerolineales bacterium]
MTTFTHQTTVLHRQEDKVRTFAWKARRFLLHFLEMQIAMGLGMIPWHWLVRGLRASPAYGEAFQRGSDLSILGHGLFMTVPMVGWMILRRHGWRHSLEMGVAMFAPGVAIIVLCWLGADTYWPWLVTLASPAGTVGMLAYMLYRRDHFTEKAGHSAHTMSAAAEPSCH